ncbi:hypothetical protein [Pseudoalteromonas umbrosa]|uniref:hypothetical protein n=1 Tax=Pseudoalteromonas umbrosa TaxID=3048489 RepID=UPI0024C3BB56|nr:hypothetical protein [Pseudoalteromonas sp. B95]MDK1290246.1 hypothetical protein [Pseudoalteromonas sp. B95]
MTTRIEHVLSLFDSIETRSLNEAKMAGKRERRNFYTVTFPTSEGDKSIIVEAPKKSTAIRNAVMLAKVTKPEEHHLMAAAQGHAQVTYYSHFIPAQIPYIEDKNTHKDDPKKWIFQSSKAKLLAAARINNKEDYIMPQIAMTHPSKNSYSLVHAYEVEEYVKKGFKVLGKDGARRRQGRSEAPYGN